MIGLEFAQPNLGDPISDGQIRAACWAIQQARAATLARWGQAVPLTFYTHAEVEAFGWTGYVDGKTDVTAFTDARGTLEIKSRVRTRLRQIGLVT